MLLFIEHCRVQTGVTGYVTQWEGKTVRFMKKYTFYCLYLTINHSTWTLKIERDFVAKPLQESNIGMLHFWSGYRGRGGSELSLMVQNLFPIIYFTCCIIGNTDILWGINVKWDLSLSRQNWQKKTLGAIDYSHQFMS